MTIRFGDMPGEAIMHIEGNTPDDFKVHMDYWDLPNRMLAAGIVIDIDGIEEHRVRRELLHFEGTNRRITYTWNDFVTLKFGGFPLTACANPPNWKPSVGDCIPCGNPELQGKTVTIWGNCGYSATDFIQTDHYTLTIPSKNTITLDENRNVIVRFWKLPQLPIIDCCPCDDYMILFLDIFPHGYSMKLGYPQLARYFYPWEEPYWESIVTWATLIDAYPDLEGTNCSFQGRVAHYNHSIGYTYEYGDASCPPRTILSPILTYAPIMRCSWGSVSVRQRQEFYWMGDVNQDGYIDQTDLNIIMNGNYDNNYRLLCQQNQGLSICNYIAGNCSWGYPSRWQMLEFHKLGDVNEDGVINMIDLEMIQLRAPWSGKPGGVPEDINGDGYVNAIDIGICAANLGLQICNYYGASYSPWGGGGGGGKGGYTRK